MSFMYGSTGLIYTGNDTHITVPAQIDGVTVRYLQPNCFVGKQVMQVTLPDTLVEISAGAFRQCEQLQSIHIPNSVTHIAGAAFQGCHALQEITIPMSVEDIGSYVFDECSSLRSVTFEGPMSYIGAYAFSDTALEKMSVPEGIEQLGNSIFFNCQRLRSVDLPQSVELIGACAFAGCVQLEKIELPTQVKTILDGAFEYCLTLKEVIFHSIPTFIHANAFSDCRAIAAVTAPMTANCLLELYNDQRYLFMNDPVKLLALTGEYIAFGQLFEPVGINFREIEGPDYRIQQTFIESIEQNVLRLMQEERFEDVLQLLNPQEDLALLKYVATAHYKLGEIQAALETYRQLYRHQQLAFKDFVQVGQLALYGTAIQATEADYALIGERFLGH